MELPFCEPPLLKKKETVLYDIYARFSLLGEETARWYKLTKHNCPPRKNLAIATQGLLQNMLNRYGLTNRINLEQALGMHELGKLPLMDFKKLEFTLNFDKTGYCTVLIVERGYPTGFHIW